MKRLIISSTEIRAANASYYRDRIKYRRGNQEFSVYLKYDPKDPSYLECQVSEIHPYDNAEYAFALKNSPSSAQVYRSGKQIGTIALPDYDEDDYEDSAEYIDTVVDQICIELRGYNKDVEPRIDHS